MMHEWIKKVWYTNTEILLKKNNEIFPFVTTWIHLEGIMLSEVSQTEKGKYFWFHWHSESKKQNKPVVTRGEEWGWGAKQVKGIKEYIILVVK